MDLDAIGDQPRFTMKEDLAALAVDISDLRSFHREHGIHFLRKAADRAAFVHAVGVELSIRLPDLPVTAEIGGETELLVVHVNHVERLAPDILGLGTELNGLAVGPETDDMSSAKQRRNGILEAGPEITNRVFAFFHRDAHRADGVKFDVSRIREVDSHLFTFLSW